MSANERPARPELRNGPDRVDIEEAPPEQIRDREDVREALRQTASEGRTRPVPHTGDKIFFTVAGLGAAVLAAFYLGLVREIDLFDPFNSPVLQRATLACLLIAGVLIFNRATSVFVVSQIESAVSKYNLKRILRLVAGVLIATIAFTVLFVNWRTTLASLGLLSLVLGLALQAPLTSFFGWVYILAKSPYRVGDRIELDDAVGDVIDVGYLDTTLWEVGGKYISGDHPSGRIIKFPNSKVLSTTIFNYSWPLFPYIWNEVKFQVAYTADFDFIARTLEEEARKEIGPKMLKRIAVFRDLLARTPVDQLNVKEQPTVFFRVNDNTWIDARVRYLVTPRNAGAVKTRLTKGLLAKVQENPDKFRVPNDNNR
ncbi:MAG TPA: mechanosensitive ion channel family protein [Thermoanaerobaculia bacterium]|jgi:small-conductance mechanosensitive channel|nr:mechanosensitive ion channel family protein [Thermoanaerobaculia bacterium]